LEEHFQVLASQGLRLLGFAERPWLQPVDQAAPQVLEEADEQGLCWLGLIGSIDPPRPEAIAAISRCRSAGIRTLMITGDHPRTALAIAKQVGLIDADADGSVDGADLVVTGRELEQLSDHQLELVVASTNVFARVLPEQKLDLVRALQRRHQVVAMTGDGVNDAPALRQSDIGVAMGITGTDVSRGAADMVLLDDNFATIVSAVQEGRLVYENVRRFIRYILGSNVGELITIAAAPLLGLPVPLSPMQILWMNLVTDGLPALALAVEQSDDNLMLRKPAGRNETIFARGLGRYILEVGFVFAAIAILLMALVVRHPLSDGNLNLDPNRWKTIVFTTLCIAQMGHALSARSERPLLQVPLFSNPWLIMSVVVTSLLQLALIYVPVLQRFFGTYPISLAELGLCLAFSLLLLLYLELRKLFKRSHH
jgi:Ca2+-transporting ATPase